MKQAFFQYNMKKNGSIDNIKKNGLIILDANALLNIYRFNKDNREKYFEILNVVKDRLVLTYQSVQEFYNNRLTIIYNKSEFKENLKKELNIRITEINNILENNNFQSENKESCNLIKHEQNLKDSLMVILNKAKKEIEKKINSYSGDIDQTFISDDEPIIDKITEIFEGKINNSFAKDELEKLYKLGKERNEAQIPPGYGDVKKIPEIKRYGDFIIWKEMINIAKNKQKDVLFVTDDRKPDWCESFKGYSLGPRKELIKEFFNETKQKFYSITTNEFIKYISELHAIEDTTELEKESVVIENELLQSSLDTDELNNLQLNPNILHNWNELSKPKLDPTVFTQLSELGKLKLDPNYWNELSKPKLDPNYWNELSKPKLDPTVFTQLSELGKLKLDPTVFTQLSELGKLKLDPTVFTQLSKLKLEINTLNQSSKLNEPQLDSSEKTNQVSKTKNDED